MRSLRICKDMSESTLLDNSKSTKMACAASFVIYQEMTNNSIQ